MTLYFRKCLFTAVNICVSCLLIACSSYVEPSRSTSDQNKKLFTEVMEHFSIVMKVCLKLTDSSSNIPLSEAEKNLMELIEKNSPSCQINKNNTGNQNLLWESSQGCPFSFRKTLRHVEGTTHDKDLSLEFFIKDERLRSYIDFYDISLTGEYRQNKIQGAVPVQNWVRVTGEIKSAGLGGGATLNYDFEEYAALGKPELAQFFLSLTYLETPITAEKTSNPKNAKNHCFFNGQSVSTDTYQNLVEKYEYAIIHPNYQDQAFKGSIVGPCQK